MWRCECSSEKHKNVLPQWKVVIWELSAAVLPDIPKSSSEGGWNCDGRCISNENSGSRPIVVSPWLGRLWSEDQKSTEETFETTNLVSFHHLCQIWPCGLQKWAVDMSVWVMSEHHSRTLLEETHITTIKKWVLCRGDVYCLHQRMKYVLFMQILVSAYK